MSGIGPKMTLYTTAAIYMFCIKYQNIKLGDKSIVCEFPPLHLLPPAAFFCSAKISFIAYTNTGTRQLPTHLFLLKPEATWPVCNFFLCSGIY